MLEAYLNSVHMIVVAVPGKLNNAHWIWIVS